MDPRDDPSVLPHGSHNMPEAPAVTSRRRLSIDEDNFYLKVVTAPPSRPSHPPPYRLESLPNRHPVDQESSRTEGTSKSRAVLPGSYTMDQYENLPDYSNYIDLEGVFMKKHEIEETTKRAEDRRWHTTFVTLQGTALNIYNVKKNRSWGRTRDGPTISPDNPPWMKKAKLEKSYSLLYADAGIAADYKKRRYVIRIRAETDQFLLSCIELSTFNKWLSCLFAAIDVALPIEDRDFPRDMSVPRVQRIRWYRHQSPSGPAIPIPTPRPFESSREPDQSSSLPPLRRRTSSPDPLPNLAQSDQHALDPRDAGGDQAEDEDESHPRHTPVFDDDDDEDKNEDNDNGGGQDGDAPHAPPRIEPPHRLSTTSYANVGIDPHSGKWFPDHQWTSAHDLLYAKLCYSNLLFRSPRKSNYIISKGKKWYVDWGTGRMVRVLPPAYGEHEYFGPWQVIHTENMRL
jgi:hypothetical protein